MSTDPQPESRAGDSLLLVFIILAAGMITATFGLLALLGWVLGMPVLVSLGPDKIPMAPSTAFLFLWYGIAVSLRARLRLRGRGFWISAAAGGVGSLVALLLFGLSSLNIHWEGEHLGLAISGTVGGAPIGHMSPVTAACFLLASLSFLSSLSRSAAGPWRRAAALVSAGLVLGTCLVLLLAYLFGTPLLYGGSVIPPALNTSLAFATLGVALLALAGRQAGPPGGLLVDLSRTSRSLPLVFIFLAAGIIVTGYHYYRNFEKHYRREVARQLTAVAELKVGDLVQWRRERLGDGAVFFGNENFSLRVRNFLEAPEDAEAKARLRTWLHKVQAAYEYDRVFLLDAQGRERISFPETPEPAAARLAGDAAEVLRSGKVTLLDFHREAPERPVHLAVLVPILDQQEAARPLGVLVLRIDPETYLYPFISRWPTPSRTAETLLVRREGNDAVFLNELRFQKDTALNLRVPLTETEQTAVKAALGQEGVVEGVDYRGAPVIAAIRAVPDSPWFMVARMDSAEVYAPVRERLWMIVVLVAVLLLAAAGGVGLVWRRQSVRFFRERYEVAEALRKTDELYHSTLDSMLEGCQIIGPDWRYLYANHTAAAHGQKTREELLGRTMMEVYPGIEETEMFAALRRCRDERVPHRMENEFVYADGSKAWFELSIQPAPEGIFILSLDITERKRAEEVQKRLLAILEATTDLVAIEDAQGNVQYMNAGGRRMLELGADEDLSGINIPGSRPDWAKQVILEQGIPTAIRDGYWKGENVLLNRSGREIPISQVIVSHKSPTGELQFLSTIIRDISKIKQAQDDLVKRSEDLARSNAELEQFAYVASHDLQEPLRMVASFVQLLQKRYQGKLDQDADEFIAFAVDGATRMQRLINDLLAFSRVGTQGKDLALTSMETALQGALTNLALAIEESGAEVSSDSLPTVMADDGQMVQLLQNLIGNAIKFRGPDPPRIRVSAEEKDSSWVFSVKDNGIGIDPQYFERVFVIFQRLHGKDEYPGTGIGLSLAKKIVERHGGKIWVESGPGQGSTFYFTIPKKGG